MSGNDNIVFEGFMGVGKTTVAKKVAELLGYRYIDTDDEVCRKAGRPICDMLSDGQCATVRALEKDVCLALSDLRDSVIATGGGVFTSDENARSLRRHSFIVCLERPFDEVYPLISSDPVRVLAYGKPYDELKRLLDSRTPKYHKYADVIISCGDADTVARAAVDAYLKRTPCAD
ncbi:MAG: shikimate kinase [Clostridia bacterium]|nr:shikimate kinase [Clostridia bacterium]